MPVRLTKKGKGSPLPTSPAGRDVEPVTELVSFLDASNRTTRTPVGWIADGSPSMTGFTEVQLVSAGAVVRELRDLPATARSVLMNVVQVGDPPAATGFREIAAFEVPPLHPWKSTPLHLALDRMGADLGGTCSDLRALGVERTEGVVVITTDGFANDAPTEVIDASVRRFLDLGKKWAVTNLVVGVGNKLDEELLKRLANAIPPLRIEELNAAVLMPFIQKVATQFSRSRRGQKIEIEVPDGIEVIE